MKRFLLLITLLFSAIFTLSSETIFMKAASKTFELEVKETVCGKDFLRFVKDKSVSDFLKNADANTSEAELKKFFEKTLK